ncbi:MAG: hypothetical protein U1D55_11290 [Phycisphaerae bacterium]
MGAVNLAGSEMTFKPARTTNVGMDSCGQYILDDSAPAKESTVTITLEQDGAG